MLILKEEKIALFRNWIKEWAKSNRIWLNICPDDWKEDLLEKSNRYIETHTGNFFRFKKIFLKTPELKKNFEKDWLPKLLETFCDREVNTKYRFKGENVRLDLNGKWAYCNTCKTTQRPFPGKKICNHCGEQTVREIDPDTDEVFSSRKGYYRKSTKLIEKDIAPISLITAEHTAQLNAAQSDENFSKAEEYELLFQDINLDESNVGIGRPAIDVLSCTTTMEVGIDIGNLSGVALRNMPPGRASYQQRAGRAGRRANAIATVIGYASSDSHDEHYFKQPDQMIKGDVKDPFLKLNNLDITKRHIRAYLLQRYYQVKCKDISTEEQYTKNLFSVLGTVADFRGNTAILNFKDFKKWIDSNLKELKNEILDWIPDELNKNISNLLEDIVEPIKEAIEVDENLEI